MSYASEVLADSPAVYLRCKDASVFLNDETANNNDATIGAGSPLFQQVGSPITNDPGDYCISFDGSAVMHSNDAATLDLGDVFTVELWAKRGRSGIEEGLVHKWNSSFGISFYPDDTFSLEKSYTAAIVSSTVTVTDTNWHHLVATKTGATCKLYIDSVDRTGVVTNSTCTDNANAMYIGAVDSTENLFMGYLDEIAVYPTALSSARISAHYAAAGVVVSSGAARNALLLGVG